MGVSNIKLVLDTCILRDNDFMSFLYRNNIRKLAISSVTYMEYRRQLLSKRKDAGVLEGILKRFNIEVIPFDKNHARYASELMSDRPRACDVCGKLDWTDTMIYAGMGDPPTILVTRNISDFPTGSGRVHTPEEAARMIGIYHP